MKIQNYQVAAGIAIPFERYTEPIPSRMRRDSMDRNMKARVHDFGRIIGRSRFVLLGGFGGLLGLLLLLGADAIDAVTTMQERNASIQSDYLARSTTLSQIRSDLYLAGTYVRDYLTERDPARAGQAAADVVRIREHMTGVLEASRERWPDDRLTSNLQNGAETWWSIVQPVLEWSLEDRHRNGYEFLREEVFPRRTALLQITEDMAARNVKHLATGNARVLVLFQDFRKRLVVLLCICVAIGLLLAGFASRRILQLERDAAVRYDEMAAARSELRELSARLLQAQEEERRAISRELHDEVGQSLSGVLVGLGNLTAGVPAHFRAHMETQISRLRHSAENSLSAIRNMCLLLRPSMLDDLGLLPALQWHAREITRNKGILVSIASDDIDEDRLSDEHKTCIYRLTQEALNNACRHASPNTIRVTVRQHPRALSVVVQDDGCGFDPKRERGLGILGMQERVARLGGTFSIVSEQSRGTSIAVTLPLTVSAASAA
jgi:signal transduction histidine kinase